MWDDLTCIANLKILEQNIGASMYGALSAIFLTPAPCAMSA